MVAASWLQHWIAATIVSRYSGGADFSICLDVACGGMAHWKIVMLTMIIGSQKGCEEVPVASVKNQEL